MVRPSEHAGDTESEGEDGDSLASRATEIKDSPGSQSPTEPENPRLELEAAAEEVEALEQDAAADEQPAAPEGQAATEAAGEDESGEDRSAEPEETAGTGAEEPAELSPEGSSEEAGNEERAEAKEEAKERKASSFRASLQLTTIREEGAAGPADEETARRKEEKTEEEGEEGKERKEEEEGEGQGGAGRRAKEGIHWTLGGGQVEDEEWSEEVKKLQEQQLRSELLEQYHALVVERSRYQRYNLYLQQKICEALRKKKGLDATAEAPDKASEPEAPEKEQAYLHCLATLEELRKQELDDLEWYQKEVGQLKQQCQDKLARVEKKWRHFQALKKQVVMQAMGSCRMQGGRQAALREVEQIQALEDKKEKQMSAVRLENVQLKQSLAHFETRMRAQEDLAEGLLLIDFEQLKIENQTFNEKAEEQNEEVLKLRSKVTNNVQIITHVKEKLHFMDMKNTYKKMELLGIEAQVALRRDILTKTKQARDSLRVDNRKLSQKCGLMGKEALLRDLEEKADKTQLLTQRLESLKRHHAGLTLSCKGVRQKIREAKAFLPS